MEVVKHVEALRNLVAERGDYRVVAEKTGVTFHWLQKFAIGGIPNPTVNNIAKLEAFFLSNNDKDAA